MSESELRVLRYLPTNLTVPEIAGSGRIAAPRRSSVPATWDCSPL
jgi:hypothetical protein